MQLGTTRLPHAASGQSREQPYQDWLGGNFRFFTNWSQCLASVQVPAQPPFPSSTCAPPLPPFGFCQSTGIQLHTRVKLLHVGFARTEHAARVCGHLVIQKSSLRHPHTGCCRLSRDGAYAQTPSTTYCHNPSSPLTSPTHILSPKYFPIFGSPLNPPWPLWPLQALCRSSDNADNASGRA